MVIGVVGDSFSFSTQGVTTFFLRKKIKKAIKEKIYFFFLIFSVTKYLGYICKIEKVERYLHGRKTIKIRQIS